MPLHWFVIQKVSKKASDSPEEHISPTKNHNSAEHKNAEKTKQWRLELLVAFVFGALAFTMMGIHTHIFSILAQLSVEQQFALFASTLIGPTQVFARFLEMTIGKKISAIFIGVIAASY